MVVSPYCLNPKGIPNLDMLKLSKYAKERTLILGPILQGYISRKAQRGCVHPHKMFMEGNVGFISKSGLLSYEACKILTENGIDINSGYPRRASLRSC